MKEKYKYVFFKYIYDKLKLVELEKDIENNNIFPVDDFGKKYEDISKYFSLENNVYESNLPEEQLLEYKKIFSLSIDQILSPNFIDELVIFIEKSYKLLLFPSIKEKSIFYGPINNNYIAPRESIVLGFHYKEFDIPNDIFDSEYSNHEKLICNILNYIQFELSEQVGINICVLKYNEYYNKVK